MTTKRARRLTKRTSLTSIGPMALRCRLARLRMEGPDRLEAAVLVAVLVAVLTTIVVGVAVAADVVLAAVLVAGAVRSSASNQGCYRAMN